MNYFDSLYHTPIVRKRWHEDVIKGPTKSVSTTNTLIFRQPDWWKFCHGGKVKNCSLCKNVNHHRTWNSILSIAHWNSPHILYGKYQTLSALKQLMCLDSEAIFFTTITKNIKNIIKAQRNILKSIFEQNRHWRKTRRSLNSFRFSKHSILCS